MSRCTQKLQFSSCLKLLITTVYSKLVPLAALTAQKMHAVTGSEENDGEKAQMMLTF